jgi:hypothetical protein
MPGVVWAAVGCGVVWAGILVAVRRRPWQRRSLRRYAVGGPVPGATTQQPDEVPAAVRAVLSLGVGGEAARADATVLNATVVELADLDVVRIEPADSAHPALVYPHAVPQAGTLPAYQSTVVSRLLHRQDPTGRPVPLTALHPSEDPTSRRWHRDFLREVRLEASGYGLLRPAAGRAAFWSLLVSGLALAGLLTDAVARYWRPHTGIPLMVFVLLGLLDLGVTQWATRSHLTRAGRILLARMRSAERRAAGAVTNTGSAGTAIPSSTATHEPARTRAGNAVVLPNQLRPLPDHQVWSDYGGEWHPLDIATADTYHSGPASPAALTLLFFAGCSLGGVAYDVVHGHHENLTTLAVFAGLPVLVAGGAVANMLHRRRLPKRDVLFGQVAKLWSVKRGDSEKGEYFYCALDVGDGPRSVRLKVGRAVYRGLRVGERVEVVVNPRRRTIRDLRIVERGNR